MVSRGKLGALAWHGSETSDSLNSGNHLTATDLVKQCQSSTLSLCRETNGRVLQPRRPPDWRAGKPCRQEEGKFDVTKRETNWKPPEGSDEFGLGLGQPCSSTPSPTQTSQALATTVFFPHHNHCNMSPLDTQIQLAAETHVSFFFFLKIRFIVYSSLVD